MNTAWGQGWVCLLVILLIVLYATRAFRKNGLLSAEAFGTSPGTMDQLASTHVPTDVNRRPDQDLQDQIQANLIKKDLMGLTEGIVQGEDHAPA